MKGEANIGTYLIDCPICDEIHEVEVRERQASTVIKGEKVNYLEKVFYCCNADDDDCEFETGKLLNENLLRARNAYRKNHGLLTSNEIVEIREMYSLSQVELSRLLGWGEATISRYESKAIQEEVYDNMLRLIKDNPLTALDFLNNNREKFPEMKFLQIRDGIIKKLDAYGKEYLSRQALEGEYALYLEESDSNGYTILNIDKLESTISYIASKVEDLFKVKLMKMLWYIDALSFKKNNRAITGLVYCHDKMGALPVGHFKIMGLENVKFEEIYTARYGTIYHFVENEKVNKDALSKEEYEIIDCVIMKFGSYTGKRLMDYMHEETAYINTTMSEIIPFSLAKGIREF